MVRTPQAWGSQGATPPPLVCSSSDLTVRGVWLVQLIRLQLLPMDFAELCRTQGVGQARMVARASSRSLGP